MILTGGFVPNVTNFLPMAVLVFIGTINPTTGDIGVHVPIEQAWLSQEVADKDRTSILATYSLIGALSIAAGALAVGFPDVVSAFPTIQVSKLTSLQMMFYGFALLGLAAVALFSQLPGASHNEGGRGGTALGPSRRRVYKLAALFSIDAFASGFVVQSMLALWLFKRFELSLASASVFFFCSNLIDYFLSDSCVPLASALGL